ncbi:MAG: hypothetical protein CMJ28_02990 [Phycisphaerae bacterium]|nr:hypothetical protein [Phycisphaerae bacterium]
MKLRHPLLHLGLMQVSVLDVLGTWMVLDRGGLELNPIADVLIEEVGYDGAIFFKFGLMLFVAVLVELISPRNTSAAHFLGWFALLVSAFILFVPG